ncbi:hypothetical protein M878_30750 [Streptomyces roseochromogenus subsp. oscitans DS 12.976]|uniref:Uncharacterized protein n=2 Tax=Streptomyces roseochromogenus TaxID=285450 RepID=V6JWU2_STRRC|nr:hypothetical protein M878_30750 [Streptomyces roseochromogenus subsp. oscitans DS 12.976]
MAIVEMHGERHSIALHALETAIEQMGGTAQDANVEDVLGKADPVRTVPADTPLKELTAQGVPSETLLVVDPQTDQPQAMISRTELAERVRGLSR